METRDSIGQIWRNELWIREFPKAVLSPSWILEDSMADEEKVKKSALISHFS